MYLFVFTFTAAKQWKWVLDLILLSAVHHTICIHICVPKINLYALQQDFFFFFFLLSQHLWDLFRFSLFVSHSIKVSFNAAVTSNIIIFLPIVSISFRSHFYLVKLHSFFFIFTRPNGFIQIVWQMILKRVSFLYLVTNRDKILNLHQ